MKVIVVIMSSSICGWVGWWMGYHLGIFTALALSMFGTGLGLYAGRKINQMYG